MELDYNNLSRHIMDTLSSVDFPLKEPAMQVFVL